VLCEVLKLLVQGAGLGFAIIKATSKPSIVSWNVHDAAGQRLSGGAGGL
jgi:hypothetical protein